MVFKVGEDNSIPLVIKSLDLKPCDPISVKNMGLKSEVVFPERRFVAGFF